MRTYRCQDCPPSADMHQAGLHGPLPARCPAHRAAHKARQLRRKRSPLHVVQPDDVAPALEPPRPAEPDAAGDEPPIGFIQEALREDLAKVFSKHPAAQTLERIADVLAQVLDSPAALVVDPRIVPPLSRELRSIVHELVTHQEAEEDDLFGGAGPVAVGD